MCVSHILCVWVTCHMHQYSLSLSVTHHMCVCHTSYVCVTHSMCHHSPCVSHTSHVCAAYHTNHHPPYVCHTSYVCIPHPSPVCVTHDNCKSPCMRPITLLQNLDIIRHMLSQKSDDGFRLAFTYCVFPQKHLLSKKQFHSPVCLTLIDSAYAESKKRRCISPCVHLLCVPSKKIFSVKNHFVHLFYIFAFGICSVQKATMDFALRSPIECSLKNIFSLKNNFIHLFVIHFLIRHMLSQKSAADFVSIKKDWVKKATKLIVLR